MGNDFSVLVSLLANISVSANTSVLLIWEMTYRYRYQPIFRHYQYRYRPIKKLHLSVIIGIGRYEKKVIGRPLAPIEVGNLATTITRNFNCSSFPFFSLLCNGLYVWWRHQCQTTTFLEEVNGLLNHPLVQYNIVYCVVYVRMYLPK